MVDVEVSAFLDQQLASGRDLLASLDRCYHQAGEGLSTEDLYGSLVAWLIKNCAEWDRDQIWCLLAVAVVERHRPPVAVD